MVGEQRACAKVYAFAFFVNIALCVLLIPLVGVAGAAVALSERDGDSSPRCCSGSPSSASACMSSSGGQVAR